MMKYLHKGFNRQGKFVPAHPGRHQQDIASFNDQPIQAEYTVWSDAKTLQQIRFIHGVVFRNISEHTGMSRDDIKDYLKRKFGKKDYYKDPEGNIQERIVSLANYSIGEMSELIERCVAWAETELDFIVDDKMRAFIEEMTDAP